MYSAPPLLLLLLPISLVVSSPLSARQLFDDLDPLASSGGTELLPSQLQGPNEQPIFFSFEEEPPLLLSDDQNSQNSFSFFPSESSVGDLFAAAAATTSDFICAASKTRVCGSANVGDTTQDLSGGGAGSGTYTLRVSEKISETDPRKTEYICPSPRRNFCCDSFVADTQPELFSGNDSPDAPLSSVQGAIVGTGTGCTTDASSTAFQGSTFIGLNDLNDGELIFG